MRRLLSVPILLLLLTLPSAAFIHGRQPQTATFDTSTVTAVALTNGNLTATNTGTTSNNQGARLANASGHSSGKFYAEATVTADPGGINFAIGIALDSTSFSTQGDSAGGGAAIYPLQSGKIIAFFADTGVAIALASGDTVGIAGDFDNHTIWFKKVSGTPGNWNNSAPANPSTNTGGIALTTGGNPYVIYATFGSTSGVANNAWTLNTGSSPYIGTSPIGFANWVP